MKTRDDFIKRLHQTERFQAAVLAARTEEERRAVIAAAEQFVDSFAVVLAPLIERAENDHEFAQQLAGQLISRSAVITINKPPALSGSIG